MGSKIYTGHVSLVSAGLSLLGCLFIILSYFWFKPSKNSIYSLIFWLIFSNMLVAVVTILNIILPMTVEETLPAKISYAITGNIWYLFVVYTFVWASYVALVGTI
jgi:hypothetical protein